MTELLNAEAEWRTWRADRNSDLAKDHGWLSLISFTWLDEERSRLGHFPGHWYANGSEAAASFQKGTSATGSSADVYRNGEPFSGEAVFALENGDSDMSLSAGTRVAEVAVRGGRYCVRVRDSAAPTRVSFTGVPVYDFDPDAVVAARFDSFGEPLDVLSDTARKGVSTSYKLVGDVVFTYKGVECRLAVSGDPAGDLQAVFYDETNGTETADWRQVTIPGPQSERGSASFVVNLNRSANFPAAFTPFGTCPKPIDSNVLAVPVRAGEKRPEPWIDPDAARE